MSDETMSNEFVDLTNEADVVILTALDVEMRAMVAALGDCTPNRWHGGTVYSAHLTGQRVMVIPSGGVGPVSATQTAQRAIDVWNPARLLLVGIAAGVQVDGVDLRLGDVLVPNQVVGYDLAKLRPGNVDPRWDVFRPDPRLVQAATEMRPAEWVHAIRTPRPDGSSDRIIPRVHLGPVLSGSKVIADIGTVDHLRTSWPHMIGLEMEGLGVALAAYRNGPGLLVVKSVSDYADPKKNDDWHRYAAESAAQFAAALLRRVPVASGVRPHAVLAAAPTGFEGRLKLHFCKHLGDSWKDLADLFAVPRYQRARFASGDEPREIWEWLADRTKLYALPAALREIERAELADYLGGER